MIKTPLWARLLRLSSVLSLLMLGAVTGIRAQPYDPALILDFLLPPEGCAAPCFLGVQTGDTVDAAVNHLEAHPWVSAVVKSADFYDIQWSGAQPDFVDLTGANYLYAPLEQVMLIRLQTQMRLGDVILALGRPNIVEFNSTASQSRYVAMLYSREGIQITAYAPCSVNRQAPIWALWEVPIEVRLEPRLQSYAARDLGLDALRRGC